MSDFSVPIRSLVAGLCFTTAVLGGGVAIGWFVRAPSDCLTLADVHEAQQAWGDAVIAIGNAWVDDGCDGALDAAYTAFDAAYSLPLLFKPTVATIPDTFRTTRDGAVSYFVGHCSPEHVPSDYGFALAFLPGNIDDRTTWKGYNATRFHGFSYVVGEGEFCNTAVAQGKVALTSRLTGTSSSVDKTFVYAKASTGLRARIVSHHSSLPVARYDYGTEGYECARGYGTR